MEEKLDLIPEKSNIRIKKKDDDYVIFNLETSGFHKVTSDVNEILEEVNGETRNKRIFCRKKKFRFKRIPRATNSLFQRIRDKKNN